jgi:Domain of unknown function (DUF4386)
MRRDWLAPATGILFVIFAVLSFAFGGEPPSADDPVEEIVDHYLDNEGTVIASAFLATIAALLLVFFANHLRGVLSAAEEGGSRLSPLVLTGAAVIAVGIAIDSTISLALAASADDIEPTSVQTLQALWDNDFLPIALGTTIFLISAGASILRTDVLPRWLGWVGIALAVLSFTPIGWVAFLAGGIWIAMLAVALMRGSPRAETAYGA